MLIMRTALFFVFFFLFVFSYAVVYFVFILFFSKHHVGSMEDAAFCYEASVKVLEKETGIDASDFPTLIFTYKELREIVSSKILDNSLISTLSTLDELRSLLESSKASNQGWYLFASKFS